ncbi:MAG: ATP-binding cassette domain-containing protein, partial [Pontimonas sp.]
ASVVQEGPWAIEFDSVSFRYPETAHKTEAEKLLAETLGTHDLDAVPTGEVTLPTQRDAVLEKVSFTIPSGSKTAIVGPSGAGKSSLLSLLERFYDPQDGTIRVFGQDITEMSRESLRSLFGYVEQDAPVLAGTIRE